MSAPSGALSAAGLIVLQRTAILEQSVEDSSGVLGVQSLAENAVSGLLAQGFSQPIVAAQP